jgi:hypothetical protein
MVMVMVVVVVMVVWWWGWWCSDTTSTSVCILDSDLRVNPSRCGRSSWIRRAQIVVRSLSERVDEGGCHTLAGQCQCQAVNVNVTVDVSPPPPPLPTNSALYLTLGPTPPTTAHFHSDDHPHSHPITLAGQSILYQLYAYWHIERTHAPTIPGPPPCRPCQRSRRTIRPRSRGLCLPLEEGGTRL